MGFKDGTNNIRADDASSFDEYVWVAVTRRTGLDARRQLPRRPPHPDAASRRGTGRTWPTRSTTIGRAKTRPARPSPAASEFDTVDLAAKARTGELVIPADAHIRLANQPTTTGMHILRRGYSFTDGIDPSTGQLDAGLFFLAYQRDPRKQFVPIQQTPGRPRRAQRVHPARRQRHLRRSPRRDQRHPVHRRRLFR